MRLTKTILLLASAALPVSALADGGGDKQEGIAPLLRPDSAPDGDAKGKVRIRHDGKKGEDEFKVEAEHLDSGLNLEVFLEDGDSSGNLVSIGTMDPDDEPGEYEFEMESEDDGLPFDVAEVAELIGRRIEIRSGSTVYLEGLVPDFGAKVKGSGKWKKGKAPLVRPDQAPDEDAKGKVEIRSRDKDNRHRFKVEAEHLDGGPFHVFVEDAVDSGVFVDAGAMESDDDEFELEFDTKDGDALPAGAATASELIGRRVEIRDASDAVHLHGVVPAFFDKSTGKKKKAKGELSGDVGKGKVEIRSKPKKNAEELRIEVAKQAEHDTVDLYMADEGGVLQLIATLETDGDGDARYRVRTKKGEALPFGVFKVEELSGRAIEIRDSATGEVNLSGTVPLF